jgi:hypothetical protein
MSYFNNYKRIKYKYEKLKAQYGGDKKEIYVLRKEKNAQISHCIYDTAIIKKIDDKINSIKTWNTYNDYILVNDTKYQVCYNNNAKELFIRFQNSEGGMFREYYLSKESPTYFLIDQTNDKYCIDDPIGTVIYDIQKRVSIDALTQYQAKEVNLFIIGYDDGNMTVSRVINGKYITQRLNSVVKDSEPLYIDSSLLEVLKNIDTDNKKIKEGVNIDHESKIFIVFTDMDKPKIVDLGVKDDLGNYKKLSLQLNVTGDRKESVPNSGDETPLSSRKERISHMRRTPPSSSVNTPLCHHIKIGEIKGKHSARLTDISINCDQRPESNICKKVFGNYSQHDVYNRLDVSEKSKSYASRIMSRLIALTSIMSLLTVYENGEQDTKINNNYINKLLNEGYLLYEKYRSAFAKDMNLVDLCKWYKSQSQSHQNLNIPNKEKLTLTLDKNVKKSWNNMPWHHLYETLKLNTPFDKGGDKYKVILLICADKTQLFIIHTNSDKPCAFFDSHGAADYNDGVQYAYICMFANRNDFADYYMNTMFGDQIHKNIKETPVVFDTFGFHLINSSVT